MLGIRFLGATNVPAQALKKFLAFTFTLPIMFSMPIWANPTKTNPYNSLAELLEKIAHDPLYATIVAEERAYVAAYNGREAVGAPQPDATRLNDLFSLFEDKYGDAFHDLRYAFSLVASGEVHSIHDRFRSRQGNPDVVFNTDSPVGAALNYEVLMGKAHPNIPGHRIDNYVPFIKVSRGFLTATEKCRQLLNRRKKYRG
jgi:hypothetical protein